MATSSNANYQNSVNESVSVKEAEEILDSVLETDIVPFLWGPPGVGKSSIVKQICDKKGWKMIDFRLSTVNPVDLMGMPTVDKEEGVAKWLPPEYLPKGDTKEKGVLFLDELNLAPLSVQAAAYQLILDKRVGAYRFPSNWRMVAAGNRETDQANVYKISAPLANRFMHISVQSDLDAWLGWARKNGIHETVIGFLAIRPALLFKMPTGTERAFPTPRSWSYVSNFINSFNYSPGTKISKAFEIAILGAVGPAVGQEFLKYVSEEKFGEINKMLDEFVKTGEITLPDTKKDNTAVLSTRFAIVGSVVKYYKEGKVNRDKFENFLSQLTSEERAVVRKNLSSSSVQLSTNESYTYLDADLESDSTSMFVNNVQAFKEKEGIAEIISPDGGTREQVSYQVQKSGKGIIIERGFAGTTPYNFIAGSVVKPL